MRGACVVVLLDGDQAFKKLGEADLDIYWGAYIGTEEEVLVAGKLTEAMADIERIRAQKREQNALNDQLPKDPSLRRAKSRPQRDLFSTSCCSG